ncbi:MAG TPA: 5-methyltetrahydropteroyltriglutamate--homocysteine S-methyltransferase [Stellaceae bacterium]|nr:5-methyltetrahydropteroyltriglutamate--homocysteine S-methyltransferase [Stellaceae bacterium]
MPVKEPPFRAEHVGSLLRPAVLKEARQRRAEGKIDAAALAAVEDKEIARIITKQEEIGLKAVTDGEFRRTSWHWDFLGGLEGVRSELAQTGVGFQGATTPPTLLRTVGKLGFGKHPMLEHFAYVKGHTRVTPKMCIPSPTHLAGVTRDWRTVVERAAYDGLEPLFADLAAAYRAALRAFADAGCTYLQIDDCNFAFLCDPKMQETLRSRGDDPQAMLRAFARLCADSLRDRPKGMTVMMHSCRGNFRSTWLTEGSWEAVADTFFNTVPVDGFFLEYESARAGGLEPLRFLPKDRVIVLGLISSKLAPLEPKDAIKRRIEEATHYVDGDRLRLSPQCGFASTQEGNQLTEDEQWRKLAHVVEIAREVWGG